MNKIVKLVINFSAIALLSAALTVGNVIAFANETAIDSVLTPPVVNNDDLELSSVNGQKMSKRLMEEGAVLLKNDGTLPLSKDDVTKVNVFGWNSIDWLYGSGGTPSSGQVAPEDDDFSKNVDLFDALDEAGIFYNTKLVEMYTRFHEPIAIGEYSKKDAIADARQLRQPNINDKAYYTQELLDYSKSYSDTAIVVIGRFASEGMELFKDRQGKDLASDDTTRHELEISTEEEALLTYVGANYEKVIVLLQTANAFECGFLDKIPGLDACMQLGFTGTRAAIVIPSLLFGDVTPSGKLADTYPYDAMSNPANAWGVSRFSNKGQDYIDYVEDIYVGYKWYETADAEGLWDNYTDAKSGKKGYEGVVQYPFGFGLSYTTFDWRVDEIRLVEQPDSTVNPIDNQINVTDKSKIEFTITVTNTGNIKGRDVVEIYVTPPYTEGGIEKSSVSLMNCVKTNILEPNTSETLNVIVDMYDATSYDCYDKNNNGFKGWELEEGTYALQLKTDSHNIKKITYRDNQIDGSFNFSVEETIKIEKDPITGNTVKNLFTGSDTVDIAPIDGGSKDGSFTANIPWFRRGSFVNPSKFKEIRVSSREISPDAVNYSWISSSGSKSEAQLKACQDWDNATVDKFGNQVNQTKPVWGKNNNFKLADSTGKINELGQKLAANYDDPQWEEVLEQTTINEFVSITNNYYGSGAIPSIGKPKLVDLDGPAQIKSFNTAPRGTGYPTMVVIASTWNPKLAYEFGKSFGDDMAGLGVSGLWGWAMDCHRDSFFGRNHESPSECAQLAGIIVSNAVKGCNTRGRVTYVKHFALYTTSSYHRHTYLSEQALREAYLKGFRKAFVEGQSLGCMTSYSCLGAEQSETTEGLVSGVLRGEWGFKGAITTDWAGYRIDSAVRAGGNFGMGAKLASAENGMSELVYSENSTARLQNRMKESIKQVTYAWLRADYNLKNYVPEAGETVTVSNTIMSWGWWKPTIYTVDAVFGIGMATWAALVLVNTFMKDEKVENKEEE